MANRTVETRVSASTLRLCRPSRWRLLPLAFGLRSSVAPAATLGRSPRVLQVRVPQLVDEGDRAVVVLRRSSEGWEVVSPQDALDWTRLDALPRAPEGGRIVEILLPEGGDAERWAVLLPYANLPLDWAAPIGRRWLPLRRALAQGRVPSVSLEAPDGSLR